VTIATIYAISYAGWQPSHHARSISVDVVDGSPPLASLLSLLLVLRGDRCLPRLALCCLVQVKLACEGLRLLGFEGLT
jgi:hypothetical protein